MSREDGHLPVAEIDREDNDSISEKVPTVSDPEPALEGLRDVYANLVERLHSPGVIEHLYSGRLLTKIEYDLAKSKESDYDKNTEVLGALMRRGPTEVVKFCQVLFEQNQHNCGRLLVDALNRREVDVSSVVIPSQTPPVVRSTSPKYYIKMKDLNNAFIALVREVKKVGRSLDPEDLRTICIELLNGVSSTKRNVQADIDALQKCEGDHIRYLQPYWDSLDCDLLHGLICQLKVPEMIRDWETYRTQVKEACTATLEECRRSLPQGRELPPNQISVGFQTTQPPNDVTVQKMLDLKDFLIKRMGLEEADFAGFTNSDVTLFFTVSRSRLPFLVRMCALHRRSLQDFSITVVFVPGEFIYDVITDQEFPYPEATSLGSEPVLQIKNLKEEMLHQFQQLQTSKVNEDAMKYEHLQNEAISLKMKLREEEMLRKKAEEEQRRIARELVKMEKKSSESGSKSNVILKKAISDVESLLGQSSESVEGLQDKIRILVEEWSKISEHEPEDASLSAGQLHQIEDLKEEMLRQFEQLQTSKVSQEQFSTLKGTLCKDHLGTIEKAVEGYQKVGAFLEDSGLLEGKLSLSIDLCQLAVEKKAEVDSMLEVLQTKQKELESDEHLSQILKRTKHRAVLKAASEKKKSEKNLIKDDTDIELSSSDSEEVPQERSLQLSGDGTTECEDELFALAYEDGVKDKYMCHVYEKSERFNTITLDYPHYPRGMYTTAKLHMVITYSTSHWSQIVQKYCKPDGGDWELCTVIQDFTVEGDVITASIPESSGVNWSCTIVGIDQVPTSSLDFTKRFPPEKDGPKLLEQAVKSSFYPPKITLMASSDVHCNFDYNRSRVLSLKLAGSSPGFQIPVKIVEWVEPGMRQPKKVSEPESDREAHEEESSSEEDVSSPSMKTGKHLPPAVQKSGMLEPLLKTKAATILSASSKEKDQQAN